MRGHGRLRALPAIKAAGEKDWRAWDGWLKLTHPAEYRGSGAKIEVSALASANLPIITAEKLVGVGRCKADNRVPMRCHSKHKARPYLCFR